MCIKSFFGAAAILILVQWAYKMILASALFLLVSSVSSYGCMGFLSVSMSRNETVMFAVIISYR
jgi:hypothetical protein